MTDLVRYGLRVITVVDAADHVVQVKLDRKRKLADQAKVAKGEVDLKNWDSLKSFIEKTVDLKSKKVASSSASPSSSKVGTHGLSPIPTNWQSLASFIQEAEDGWQPEDLWRHVGAAGTAEAVAEASWWETATSRRPRTEAPRRQGGSWEVGRKRQGPGHLSPVSGGGTYSDSVPPHHHHQQPLRYDVPSSYPDWLLTIPTPMAVDYITLCTPINVLLASQYKDLIHVSPGVDLPKEISFELSVGMRFMFHSKRNSDLIKSAWHDFVRRLRWRLYFSFLEDDNTDYDPDYEVDRKRKDIPLPVLPAYIELGIQRGWNFVRNTISNIPLEKPEDSPYSSLAPPVHLLRSFMLERDYIVTGTDKNLGIAVSKKEWIIDKCNDLLADTTNYKERSIIEVNMRCIAQCEEMVKLADHAAFKLGNNQLATYLRSKVTPFEDEKTKVYQTHSVPTFYGIPKIHKEPVKMRPIIPCHSAIQNPAAKYVSKRLKPLIKAATSIIHGSKDLVIKLSKLSLKPGKRWYICTGDVVAYYPSIPIRPCTDIVLSLYEEYIGTLGVNNELLREFDEDVLLELELFTRCLLVGNTHLITQFQGKYFEQLRGLAMGVASSPDLANAYGWYFERKCEILQDARMAFYGRYIDDCLAIVYASSETEARSLVSQITFDDCVIEWDVSGASAPFLDLLLFKDSYGRLQHQPYRKARNHQERVPWISHHPFDVKRGTFIGEMSRLATLSSTHDSYLEALQFLGGLYVKRGYPMDLVKSWLKKYTAERWNKRLTNVEASAQREVLVLKSEFNTAWNYFSASQLGDTIIGFWREYLSRADKGQLGSAFYPAFSSAAHDLEGTPDALTSTIQCSGGFMAVPDLRKIGFLDRRMIVSRKRTRNLFDLTTLWKKLVLTGLDREVSGNPDTVTDTHLDGDNDDFDIDEHVIEGIRQTIEWQPLLERGVVLRASSPPGIRTHAFDHLMGPAADL